MFARLSRTVVVAVLAICTVGSARAAAQFTTGPLYAGPRIGIGGLSGGTSFGVQIEKGFTEPGATGPGIIGGGLGVDYYSFGSYSNYSFKVIPVRVFGSYHFVIESNTKIDPYVGLALVYSIFSTPSGCTVAGRNLCSNPSSFRIAGHGGVRYFISENMALHGQLGFGYSVLGLGVDWKF